MTRAEVLRDFGQLFIMAFDGLKIPIETAEFFKSFRIGGIILFSDNFENARQLKKLTAELQLSCASPGLPLFITTDHEGGRVQRFRKDFTIIPPMGELGTRDPARTEKIYSVIAKELLRSGVNFNLAPVADVCPTDPQQAIGDRSFGNDHGIVAEHVAAAVRGLQSKGILSCVKHFPGHGATSQDSHRELPVSNSSYDQLSKKDLIPFRAAIKEGVAAVMTAHVVYPKAGDADLPATLSRYWLQKILREGLGFEGLIITDAIEMKGLMNHWSPAESGLKALEAGADILIYYREAHQFKAFYELRAALERNELDYTEIKKRIERVKRFKRRYLQK